jgi:hypothetical protein
MERIAIIDFFDERESVTIRHEGPDPDAIYADLEGAYEAEGFDTIILYTREELVEGKWMTDETIDALPTPFIL